MAQRSFTNYFILKALSDPDTDLRMYADQKFSDAVRLIAIEAITVILLKINSDQIYTQAKQDVFNLNLRINTPHPQSGLHLLDYCLVAGFYELAARFSYSGAVCKSGNQFSINFANTFKDDERAPAIVQDIFATINQSSYIRLSKSKFDIAAQPSALQKIKSIYTDHPYSALLFTVGAVCSLVSPFAHGYATALLLSVGVPSLLSSVNLMQNSAGGKDNKRQVELQDRTRYEVKEVRDCLDSAKEIKHELLNVINNYKTTEVNKVWEYVSEPFAPSIIYAGDFGQNHALIPSPTRTTPKLRSVSHKTQQ